jgi:hypothetical protein
MAREFIQFGEDLFIMPGHVAAVKRSSLQDEHCTIIMKGMSAQDGFVVDQKAEDVVEEIEEALAEE